jgi:protein-S-isoprenylcysteine O-methyltransferase Ste14
MILKEERYLDARHGQAYRDYQRRVPRYLLR